MASGIHDTNKTKKIMGTRLRAARGKAGYTRQKFADLLSNHRDRPVERGDCAAVGLERLRKWESGENAIALEWLPAICDVLHCDAGYLFGEYEELTRTAADICAETGLTEGAIEHLMEYDQNVKEFISFLLSSGAINQIGLSVSQCIDTRLKLDHHKRLLLEIPCPPLLDASDISAKRTKVADAIKQLDEVYTARLWHSGKYAETAIEEFIEREAEKYGKNEH